MNHPVKVFTLIILTTILVPIKSLCQQDTSNAYTYTSISFGLNYGSLQNVSDVKSRYINSTKSYFSDDKLNFNGEFLIVVGKRNHDLNYTLGLSIRQDGYHLDSVNNVSNVSWVDYTKISGTETYFGIPVGIWYSIAVGKNNALLLKPQLNSRFTLNENTQYVNLRTGDERKLKQTRLSDFSINGHLDIGYRVNQIVLDLFYEFPLIYLSNALQYRVFGIKLGVII